MDRPNGTTMEGMLWNANHVLETALSPKINGLPKKLFEECIGIVITTAIQGGFILAGTMGSGIAMMKTGNGTWSPPCAVGLAGISFGLLAGLEAKDIVIFVMDEDTMRSLYAKHGFRLGSQLEVTVGIGRAAQSDIDFTKKGVGAAFALAYTKGAFAGLSIEGAKIGTREFVNNKFYNTITTAESILTNQVAAPESKKSLLDPVYDKLKKLEAGATAEPTPEDAELKRSLKEAADKEHEEVKNIPEAEIEEVKPE